MLFLTALLAGCVDLDFDEPPVPATPVISANTTIQELKKRHSIGAEDQLIDSDIIIGGVVIADDQSGNLFNSIIIQDETGGIELRLNAAGLYNDFPIGRMVYVRAQGLYLGDNRGVIQLNGSPGTPLEEPLIDDHVIGAVRNQNLDPDTLTLSDLSEDRINTLIHLKDMQFIESDTGVVFADVANRKSLNRTMEDCEGNSLFLQTSGFARFAGEMTPGARGGITAIYRVSGNNDLLIIRDLADLDFGEERCGQPSGGSDPEFITIAALRDSFADGIRVAPANTKIKGVVISDKDNGNSDARTLILQEERSGIVIRFQEAHEFALGEEIELNISGQELVELRGLLVLNQVRNSRATSLGNANLPGPRLATLEEIEDNAFDWESTLVRVENVTLSGSDTWAGLLNAIDDTGSMILFTRSGASFAAEPLPDNKVTLVAIVSQFDDLQLVIRNLNDVTEGPDTGITPLTELYEPFTSQNENTDIALTDWVNLSVKGEQRWVAKEFNGNKYAEITAYNAGSPEIEAWLISPPILLNEPRNLSFRSAQAFYEHDGLSVWISKDFNGDNFNSATWTQLSAAVADNNVGQNQWVPSGDTDLSEFDGVVYIGFRYVGTNTTNTTTYRIDDVRVE